MEGFIARKKAALSVSEKNSLSSDYAAGYQATLKELLDTAIVSGDGDLFLFRRNARIPIRLVDFKEKAERTFSNGKKNPLYHLHSPKVVTRLGKALI